MSTDGCGRRLSFVFRGDGGGKTVSEVCSGVSGPMTTAFATALSDQGNVEHTDVLIIGAGMAGLCAAIAARHAGASVILGGY